MGLSPENHNLIERIFGRTVMLDEEGEDWNALLDAARAEATEAKARRIGELEDGLDGVARWINRRVSAGTLGATVMLAKVRALLPHDIKEPSDDR